MSLLDTGKAPPPPKKARAVKKLNAAELDEEERAERARMAALRSKVKQSAAPGSAGILPVIADRALTTKEIAALTGHTVSNVNRMLNVLRRSGRAHIACFRSGQRVPFKYRAGPSPVGAEPFFGYEKRLPYGNSISVLVALLDGERSYPNLANIIPGYENVSTTLNMLVCGGWANRDGKWRAYTYTLTDIGRQLAEYIVKLEEAYGQRQA